MREKLKTILIASTFNTTVGNHYLDLLKVYSNQENVRLIFISDKFRIKNKLTTPHSGILFFDWPTIRPDNLKAFFYGFKLFWKFRPDIVISNFGSTWLIMILAKLFNTKRKLVHYHTPSQQMMADFKAKVYRTRLLNFLYSKIANKIIVSSEYVKNDLLNNYKVTKDKIILVPFLVGDTVLSRAYVHKNTKEISFFYPGRLYPSKGHIEFIDNIFYSFKKKYPNSKLIINGAGPLRKEIEKKIMDLGLNDSVKIQEPTTYEDYLHNLRNSSFMCGLSLMEGFGLVFLEALSQGSVVITRDIQPMNEFIPNQFNLLLNGYDYETILNKLFELVDNPILYNDYCEKNIQWVMNNYSIESRGSKYADVLFGEY